MRNVFIVSHLRKFYSREEDAEWAGLTVKEDFGIPNWGQRSCLVLELIILISQVAIEIVAAPPMEQ